MRLKAAVDKRAGNLSIEGTDKTKPLILHEQSWIGHRVVANLRFRLHWSETTGNHQDGGK